MSVKKDDDGCVVEARAVGVAPRGKHTVALFLSVLFPWFFMQGRLPLYHVPCLNPCCADVS